MIDLRLLREKAEWVAERIATRGDADAAARTARLAELDRERRRLQALRDDTKHKQGRLQEEMKAAGGDPARRDALRAELRGLSDAAKDADTKMKDVEGEMEKLSYYLPNLPADDVPPGADESANVEVRRWGTPRPADEKLAHWDTGPALGMLDFDGGAKLSGARFTVLRDAGAALSRALIQFMLDLHTREHGFTEVAPPYLVSRATMTGTGQLPKFEDDAFKTQGDPELFLIPTAEVPLVNLHRDDILDVARLPIRYAAYTACFRREAGSAGKDTRGLIRQHQFDKVELVAITRPEDSAAELERIAGCAEEVLKRLGLAYRVMQLCTADLGFGAAKTYDLEVWLAGQGRYREISSCSDCHAFQARRAAIRFRRAAGAKPEHVHTLNGSGVAVGRTLVALLENCIEADGALAVPEVLRPYLAGRARIEPPR
ncbi:MAG TPA: serine--tRNA ligase [Myxococcota bacterium]|jgi:seryl-tRNA synthetase|nr:serine--tRNA ligase [Myxococcota bacterium]